MFEAIKCTVTVMFYLSSLLEAWMSDNNYETRGAANLIELMRAVLHEFKITNENRMSEPVGDGEWRPLPSSRHLEPKRGAKILVE
jgi:hypothetical protein